MTAEGVIANKKGAQHSFIQTMNLICRLSKQVSSQQGGILKITKKRESYS